MRAAEPRQASQRAFTLVELLVVIAILAILLAVLMPSVSLGLDAARSAKCSARLRNLFMAQMNYSADHESRFTQYWTTATPINWMVRLQPYMGNAKPWDPRSAFNCPGIQGAELDLIRNYCESYGLTTVITASDWDFTVTRPQSPTLTILMGDMNVTKSETMLTSDGYRYVSGRWQALTWGNRPGFRHHGREQANMVFMDGHVERLGLTPLKHDAAPNLWYWGK